MFVNIQEQLFTAFTSGSHQDKVSTAIALEEQIKVSLTMVEVSQHLNFSYNRRGKVSGWMSDEASLQIWLSVKFLFPIYKCELTRLLPSLLSY